MSRGVGRRRGSDPALLRLWRGPAGVAPIPSLVWEPPCAAGVALKRQKKKYSCGFQFIPRCAHCHHLMPGHRPPKGALPPPPSLPAPPQPLAAPLCIPSPPTGLLRTLSKRNLSDAALRSAAGPQGPSTLEASALHSFLAE